MSQASVRGIHDESTIDEHVVVQRLLHEDVMEPPGPRNRRAGPDSTISLQGIQLLGDIGDRVVPLGYRRIHVQGDELARLAALGLAPQQLFVLYDLVVYAMNLQQRENRIGDRLRAADIRADVVLPAGIGTIPQSNRLCIY